MAIAIEIINLFSINDNVEYMLWSVKSNEKKRIWFLASQSTGCTDAHVDYSLYWHLCNIGDYGIMIRKQCRRTVAIADRHRIIVYYIFP